MKIEHARMKSKTEQDYKSIAYLASSESRGCSNPSDRIHDLLNLKGSKDISFIS